MPGLADPKLLQGGDLREFTHAMCATLVMYYEESANAGEVLLVTQHMRTSLVRAGVAKHKLEAGPKLIAWSAAIKKQFAGCNLHLSSRAKAGD